MEASVFVLRFFCLPRGVSGVLYTKFDSVSGLKGAVPVGCVLCAEANVEVGVVVYADEGVAW